MLFETHGDRNKPAVLFFHAMGVTGQSSRPVAEHLPCFCILPTSTVYCAGQRYAGKADEVRQVEDYLRAQGVKRLALGRSVLHRRGPRHGVFDADEPAGRPCLL